MMLDVYPSPLSSNAFRGMIFAVGATRWMTPATMVPCPKAAWPGWFRTEAEAWSTPAMVAWFTPYTSLRTDADAWSTSARSLPPGTLRVKS